MRKKCALRLAGVNFRAEAVLGKKHVMFSGGERSCFRYVSCSSATVND